MYFLQSGYELRKLVFENELEFLRVFVGNYGLNFGHKIQDGLFYCLLLLGGRKLVYGCFQTPTIWQVGLRIIGLGGCLSVKTDSVLIIFYLERSGDKEG